MTKKLYISPFSILLLLAFLLLASCRAVRKSRISSQLSTERTASDSMRHTAIEMETIKGDSLLYVPGNILIGGFQFTDEDATRVDSVETNDHKIVITLHPGTGAKRAISYKAETKAKVLTPTYQRTTLKYSAHAQAQASTEQSTAKVEQSEKKVSNHLGLYLLVAIACLVLVCFIFFLFKIFQNHKS